MRSAGSSPPCEYVDASDRSTVGGRCSNPSRLRRSCPSAMTVPVWCAGGVDAVRQLGPVREVAPTLDSREVSARREVPAAFVGPRPLRLQRQRPAREVERRSAGPDVFRQDGRGRFGRQLEPRAIGELARHAEREGPLAVPLAARDVDALAEVAARGTHGHLGAHAAELVGPPRDDVDHAQEGVRAVERRRRAADDLDLRDGLEGDELRAQPVSRGRPVGHRAPVDHHLDDAALRAEPARHAPHGRVGEDVIVDQIEALHVLEDLGDGLVAPADDVGLGHDLDDGGRFVLALGGLRGRRDLDVEELHEVEVVERLAPALVRVRGPAQQDARGEDRRGARHGAREKAAHAGAIVRPVEKHRQKSSSGSRLVAVFPLP